MNVMATVERVQTGDELERHPLPIPFGWFLVGLSGDVSPGELKIVNVFDKEWVLFRNGSGDVGMTDPYCPHLGAHIGHGGKVVDDNVRCPFHFWEFDTKGWCRRIPYAKVMPGVAKRKPILQALPVKEKYGGIFAWYHPYGDEPLFDVIDIPELDAAMAGDGYIPIIRQGFDIPTMMQESMENGVDHVHLHYLHHAPEIPPATKLSTDGYYLTSNNNGGMIIAESMGPGTGSVRFTQGDVVFTAGVFKTPVTRGHSLSWWFSTYKDYPAGSPERKAAHRMYLRSSGKDPDGGDEAGFEEVDIIIWKHKKYRPRPLLCDGDGPILQFRQWYRQFYAEPVDDVF